MRLRLRYSTRLLFAGTTVLCVLAAWISLVLLNARKQERNVIAIEKLGAIVEYDFEESGDAPSSLRTWLGPHILSEVNSVSFFSDAVHENAASKPEDLRIAHGDEDLIILKEFASCKRVMLNDTAITNQGLKLLQQMERLEVLSLQRTQIDDGSVELLGRLKGLKWLFVDQTNVTEDGYLQLKQLLPHTRIWHENADNRELR